METTGKRVEFLKYACAQLGLTGVEFAKERAADAARKLGKSRSALANSLRLLNLPETCLLYTSHKKSKRPAPQAGQNGRNYESFVHPGLALGLCNGAVSYTHLDVYKRQAWLPC